MAQTDRVGRYIVACCRVIGLAGVGKRIGWLLLTLAPLAGCSAGFGDGYQYGPAFVAPEKLAAEAISGCAVDEFAQVRGRHFTALAEMQLRGQLRVLRPGQGLTRDLMADRLNVQVDGNGIVLRVFCG